MKKWLLCLIYFFTGILWAGLILGQSNIPGQLVPFIKNFTKGEYKAANKNWSVTQDKEGILYFGNTYGLLEFNGADWNLHSLPGPIIIRSVYADFDGCIYSGAFEEFGYWQRNSFGDLYYTSLSQEFIKHEDLTNISIWTIKRIGEYIFFHSFRKIFVYDGIAIIEIINPNVNIFSFFEYKGKPYVFLLNNGLFRINDYLQLEKEPSPDFISELRIKDILFVTNDTSLVVTEYLGVFHKIGNNWDQVKSPENCFLKNYHINKALKINDDLFAIGTISHGVLFIKSSGQIVMYVDKNNGLQNNTVLALWKDPDKNIWIGMNKGIDLIEINSPFFFFYDKSGELGSVTSSAIYKGKLYIGTNHGLFYTDWIKCNSMVNFSFESVPGLKGHVMSLKVIDDQLICGFNTGTCKIENGKTRQLFNIGGEALLVNPFGQDIGYQGIYTGLALYEKDKSGQWGFKRVLKETDYTNYLQIDHLGNLWASSEYKGLYMYKLNSSGDSILNTFRFGTENGFVSEFHINVFKFDNRVIFSNGGIFFTYDYFEHKIVPYTWLNNQLGNFVNAHIVYNPNPEEYWFISKTSLGLFHYLNDTLSLKYELNYNFLHTSAGDFNENITKLDDHYYLIGLDDGFAIFDYNLAKYHLAKPLPELRINKITCYTKAGKSNQVNIINPSKPKLPFNSRNLLLNFSIPGITQETLTFYYRLSRQEYWINLGNNNELRYENMNWGSNSIEIKAVEDISGESHTVSFPIEISYPWFLHWMTIIIYIIFVAAIVLIIKRINKIRSDRQKVEYLSKIRAENEEKMVKAKNEYLQAELKNKSRELVNYTILLRKRNEVLQQLKSRLVIAGNPYKISNSVETQKLVEIINSNLSDKNEWAIFKIHFDAAHSDFLEKLKALHPSLTPSDLRFCAFLRMNLNSKEIASLLIISLRSIEVKRYRLRKKLKLQHDQNLIEYLMTI